MARPPMIRPRAITLFDRFNFRLVRRDMWMALQVWLLLELASLLLLPNFRMIQGENRFAVWLSMSIPIGLLGGLLVALSSEFIRICEEHYRPSTNKRSLVWLGLVGSWLGLAGVGFPLSIAAVELWFNFQSLGK